MALLSMDDHLKDEIMSQVHVRALRGFVHDSAPVKPDDELTVSRTFARQLVAANQAVVIPALTERHFAPPGTAGGTGGKAPIKVNSAKE